MKAELIDHMGTDLTVVNAARVSFAKESWWANEENWLEYDAELRLRESDAKLISYLADHGHWTPFGHPQVMLRITAPIPIRTQCFKHKQGFVENEVSRRYVDDKPEFFWPVLRQRAEDKKQGSKDEFPARLEACENALYMAYEVGRQCYDFLLKEGVAPEQARMALPQGMLTQWYWTGSLAAYARFYRLRQHEDAQKEIQDLAQMIGDVIEPLFPVSWKALT